MANLHRYASYGIVEQVLCFNNGAPLGRMAALPPKCVLIESSGDLGLYSRLAAASLAKTAAIFHTDDDLGVPEATLQALFDQWRAAPHCCHGLYGRLVQPLYRPENVYGPVEVVLTRALICSRVINNSALSAIHLFDEMEAVPHGNGEDIILSFTAMAMSRQLNVAHRLQSEDYPDHDAVAIHRRWRHHFAHRQKVVARCRQVFSL
jgi:hypothetical protein